MQPVPLAEMDSFREQLLRFAETQNLALCRRIDESGQMSEDDQETLLQLSKEFLTQYQAAEKSGE